MVSSHVQGVTCITFCAEVIQSRNASHMHNLLNKTQWSTSSQWECIRILRGNFDTIVTSLSLLSGPRTQISRCAETMKIELWCSEVIKRYFARLNVIVCVQSTGHTDYTLTKRQLHTHQTILSSECECGRNVIQPR